MSLLIKAVRAVESSVANLQLGKKTRSSFQRACHTTKPTLNSRPSRRQTVYRKMDVEGLSSCFSQTDSEFETLVRDKTFSVSIPRPMFQAEGPVTEQGCSGDRWRIESTFDALSLLLRLCKLYGFRDDSYSLQRSYDLWWNQSLSCGLVKFLKYKMAAFFAHYSDQELPPKPTGLGRDFPQHLLCGSAGRFITHLMRGDKDIARTFVLAILYLKKGLPRPSSAHVECGVKDTFHVLTSLHPPKPCEVSFHANPTPSLDTLRSEVRRTVYEVFEGEKYPDRPSAFAPSLKANYVNSRSKYGTLGTLRDCNILQEGSRDPFVDLFAFEQIQFDESGVPNYHVPVVSVNLELAPRVQCLFTDVYSKCREAAKTESDQTKLVGLSEALKVRVISKGPPLAYFVLHPLQKFMHSILRKHPTFTLVGQPATTQIISDLFGDYSGEFLSADYSAATDMLNPTLSEEAVNAVCDCCQVPDDLRKLFHTALTGHTICMPGDQRRQTWGQLMGSIVSFPILCIVNATICRMAYQAAYPGSYTLHESLSKFRLEQIPLCVNGDDALLRCDRRTFKFWKSYACLAGLLPSVGKVYLHPRYSNINSMSFHNGVLIPYVNFGLMLGLTRSSIPLENDSRTVWERDFEFLSNVGSRHTELLNSCPADLQLAVHRSFLKLNWKILRKYPIPWYIPKSRGGLGLQTVYVDVNGVVTSEILSTDSSRFGPSRMDLICGELQLQSLSEIPCFTELLEYSARRAWSSSILLPPKAWALPDDPYRLACSDSQKYQFQSLDLAAYYLSPDSLIRNIDNALHCKFQLRNLTRYWRRIYGLASSQPYTLVRDKIFEYVQYYPLLIADESDDSISTELD